MENLHGTKGDKRTIINKWNGVLGNTTVVTVSCERLGKYPSFMGEAVVVRNKIVGLDEREKLDEGKAYFGKDGNDSIGN